MNKLTPHTCSRQVEQHMLHTFFSPIPNTDAPRFFRKQSHQLLQQRPQQRPQGSHITPSACPAAANRHVNMSVQHADNTAHSIPVTILLLLLYSSFVQPSCCAAHNTCHLQACSNSTKQWLSNPFAWRFDTVSCCTGCTWLCPKTTNMPSVWQHCINITTAASAVHEAS